MSGADDSTTQAAVGAPNTGRETLLRVLGYVGAVLGYGGLAAFLYLIGMQIFRWFRQGEWTHIGISEALRTVLIRCGADDADTGRLAALLHWLEAPATWLGLHKVIEVVPASLALFLVSIIGNSIFLHCRDRVGESNHA